MSPYDIKRGDILVAYYPDVSLFSHKRNYIIFIADGKILNRKSGSYEIMTIGTLAHINLGNHFCTNGSIGFTLQSVDHAEESVLRKPTYSEVSEINSVIKKNKCKFNRRNKKFEIKYDYKL